MYIHTPKAHPVRMYMANSKNDYLSHKSASMMCVILAPHFPSKAMLTPAAFRSIGAHNRRFHVRRVRSSQRRHASASRRAAGTAHLPVLKNSCQEARLLSPPDSCLKRNNGTFDGTYGQKESRNPCISKDFGSWSIADSNR